MPGRSHDVRDAPVSARASLLEAVVDAVPFTVTVWSLPPGGSRATDVTLVAWNPEARIVAPRTRRVGLAMGEMEPELATSDRGQAIFRAIQARERADVRGMPWPDASGEQRYYDIVCVPLPGAAAAVVGHDVTARVRAQVEAEALQALVASAPFALAVWRLVDPEDLLLELINDAGARLAGRPAADLLGRRLGELGPAFVGDVGVHDYARVARGELPTQVRDVRHRAADGREHALTVTVWRISAGRVGVSASERERV